MFPSFLIVRHSNKTVPRQATLRDPEKHSLDDMYEAAQEILQDLAASGSPEGADPAFLNSFFIYPNIEIRNAGK